MTTITINGATDALGASTTQLWEVFEILRDVYTAQIASITTDVVAPLATVSFAGATGVFTKSIHGLSEADPVRVAYAPPATGGIDANTDYYVKDPTNNTFKLAATPGGDVLLFDGMNATGLTVTYQAVLVDVGPANVTKRWGDGAVPIVVPGEWTYVGFTRRPWTDGQSVTLHVNDQSTTFNQSGRLIYPSGRTAYLGRGSYSGTPLATATGTRDPGGGAVGFIGDVWRAWMAPGTALTAAQHATWYQLGAAVLGLPAATTTAAIGSNVVELDPNDFATEAWDFEPTPDEWHGVDLLDENLAALGEGQTVAVVRVRGEGSLGLEVEPFEPGEVATVELTARIEVPAQVGEELTLATLGGGDDPIRLAFRTLLESAGGNGEAVMRHQLVLRRGIEEAIAEAPWNCAAQACTFQIAFDDSEVLVSCAGQNVGITAPNIDPRFYLGSGYREDRSPSTTFRVAVSSIRSWKAGGW